MGWQNLQEVKGKDFPYIQQVIAEWNKDVWADGNSNNNKYFSLFEPLVEKREDAILDEDLTIRENRKLVEEYNSQVRELNKLKIEKAKGQTPYKLLRDDTFKAIYQEVATIFNRTDGGSRVVININDKNKDDVVNIIATVFEQNAWQSISKRISYGINEEDNNIANSNIENKQKVYTHYSMDEYFDGIIRGLKVFNDIMML